MALSREEQQRKYEERNRLAREYTPPSVLPTFKPPAGMVFKWVATHVLGQQIPENVARNVKDGWRIYEVNLKDPSVDPEMKLLADHKGHIVIGGSTLFMAPVEKIARRDAYFEVQAQGQEESVKAQFMRNSDARMPLFSESKSDTTRGSNKFGSGS